MKSYYYFRFSILIALCSFVFMFIVPIYIFGIEFACLFNLLTDIACPLCGFTRSFENLFYLDFSQAFYFYPFSYVVVIIGILILVDEILLNFKKKSIFYKFCYRNTKFIVTTMTMLFLLNWMTNIFKGI